MDDSSISFSVVIPTFERPERLLECLEALATLDYPRDQYEVIVVDDGSARQPESIIAPFRERLEVTLISKPNEGPAIARNTGAACASGEFLAFIDDDCIPDRAWLRRLSAIFARDPVQAVGGRVINRLTRNSFSTASQSLVEYVCNYLEGKAGQFFTSNNLALPVSMFRAIGGFHDALKLPAAEDREFCVRLRRLGHRLSFAPDAIVYHAHVMDLLQFWRQHFTYGRGAYYFRILLEQAGHEPVRIEPLTFYSGLLLHPFSGGFGFRPLFLSSLLMITQLANALGYFYETFRRTLIPDQTRVRENLA